MSAASQFCALSEKLLNCNTVTNVMLLCIPHLDVVVDVVRLLVGMSGGLCEVDLEEEVGGNLKATFGGLDLFEGTQSEILRWLLTGIYLLVILQEIKSIARFLTSWNYYGDFHLENSIYSLSRE